MAGTRQSARQAAQGSNSSPPSATTTNATKRKADAASPTSNKKQQKTLEEVTLDEDKREEVKAAISNDADNEQTDKDAETEFDNQDVMDVAGMLIECPHLSNG